MKATLLQASAEPTQDSRKRANHYDTSSRLPMERRWSSHRRIKRFVLKGLRPPSRSPSLLGGGGVVARAAECDAAAAASDVLAGGALRLRVHAAELGRDFADAALLGVEGVWLDADAAALGCTGAGAAAHLEGAHEYWRHRGA